MTERTGALCELFEKSSPYTSGSKCFSALNDLRTHPFNKAFVIVNATTETTVRSTRLRIKTALQIMEECNPAVSELESALLLHEAELLSVSNTIKDLHSSLIEAQAQLGKKTTSDWDAVILLPRKQRCVSSCVKPSLQLLQHFEAALETLEGTVGRWRLLLTLCKEELALYKREMFAFARLGVLSCSDPGGQPEDDSEKCAEERGAVCGGTVRSASLPKRRGGKQPRVAASVASVVDRVITKATRTVTSASLSRRGHMWSLVRGCGAGGFEDDLRIPGEEAVPHFTYTMEEEKRLEEANIVLQKQQRDASAEDARIVEASVRELSQLTSLMSEQVMQQNEQFSILLKNTEMAQSNMQKGVDEVGKTLTRFWNSTRQLIACLWFCTLLLLISNSVIR